MNTMNNDWFYKLKFNRSMKKLLLSFFVLVATISIATGQNANDWFITVWKTSGTAIKFPAYQVNNGLSAYSSPTTAPRLPPLCIPIRLIQTATKYR